MPTYVFDGTPGADTFNGSVKRDLMYGRDGNDIIRGYDGDDYINGGNGNDRLGGFNGADFIEAGNGDDSIWGDAGDDRLVGGAGNDTIQSGTGIDAMEGEAGNDRLMFTGEGCKSAIGGDGNDVIEMYGLRQTTSDSNSGVSGGNGYDTMRFEGLSKVNGQDVKTVILDQDDSVQGGWFDGYKLSYQTTSYKDYVAFVHGVEKFDFSKLPGKVDAMLKPFAGSELEILLSAGNDRVSIDFKHGTQFSATDLHGFTRGKDLLILDSVTKADVSVTAGAGGTLVEVGDADIFLAGVSGLTYGADWFIA